MSISIQGVPPQFDQAVLQKLQEQQVNVYTNTTQCLYRLRSDHYRSFFTEYGELYKQGYTVSDELPLLSPTRNMILLNKPTKMLAQEVEAIKANVKLEYIAQLEEEHERYKELLVQQMLAADEAKEQKALEAKKNKRLNEIMSLAEQTYTPLSVPE